MIAGRLITTHGSVTRKATQKIGRARNGCGKKLSATNMRWLLITIQPGNREKAALFFCIFGRMIHSPTHGMYCRFRRKHDPDLKMVGFREKASDHPGDLP